MLLMCVSVRIVHCVLVCVSSCMRMPGASVQFVPLRQVFLNLGLIVALLGWKPAIALSPPTSELGLQVFVGMFYSLNDFWDLIWVLMIVGHMLLTTEPSVSPETRFSYSPLRFRRKSSKAG